MAKSAALLKESNYQESGMSACAALTLQTLIEKTCQAIMQIRQILSHSDGSCEHLHTQHWLDCLLDLRMILSGLIKPVTHPRDKKRWDELGLDFLQQTDLLLVARICTRSLYTEMNIDAAVLPRNWKERIYQLHNGVQALINDARVEKPQ